MTSHDPDKQSEESIIQADFNTFVRFSIARGMHSKYAQHVMIQPGENEVVFSFFEIIMPPLFGPPEVQAQVQAQIQENGVPADCVARITIPISRFPAFVAAMQGVLERLTIQGEGNEPNHENNTDDDQSHTDGTENP